MKKIITTAAIIFSFSCISHSQNIGIGTASPANTLSISGNGSIGSGYTGTIAPTNGLIVQGIVGIGVSTGLTTAQISILSTSSARDGIRAMNSATSVTGTYGSVRGELTGSGHTSATGYLAYHRNSNQTFGVFTTGGDYGAWFDRMVGIGSSQPTTQNDLEVANIVGGIPATIILRQSSSNATSGMLLGNLDFGDQRTKFGQARIQCIRGAPSSDSTDVPTDLVFFTTSDQSNTLIERMRISHLGVLSLNGLAGLGQGVFTQNGTAPLVLGSDSTNYIAIPGLSDSVTIQTGTKLWISTDGCAELQLSGATDYAIVRISIFINGNSTLERDVICANANTLIRMKMSWAISSFFNLAPGAHAVGVRTKLISTNVSNPSVIAVSGGSASSCRGSITSFTIKN